MTYLVEIHKYTDYSLYIDLLLTLGVISFLFSLYLIQLKYRFITNEDIFEQNEKLKGTNCGEADVDQFLLIKFDDDSIGVDNE